VSSRLEARFRKVSSGLRSSPCYSEHTSVYTHKRMQWSVWNVREAKRMGGVLLNNAVSSNDFIASGLTKKTWVGSMARKILTGKNLSQVHPVHHRYHMHYITCHKTLQRVLIVDNAALHTGTSTWADNAMLSYRNCGKVVGVNSSFVWTPSIRWRVGRRSPLPADLHATYGVRPIPY